MQLLHVTPLEAGMRWHKSQPLFCQQCTVQSPLRQDFVTWMHQFRAIKCLHAMQCSAAWHRMMWSQDVILYMVRMPKCACYLLLRSLESGWGTKTLQTVQPVQKASSHWQRSCHVTGLLVVILHEQFSSESSSIYVSCDVKPSP